MQEIIVSLYIILSFLFRIVTPYNRITNIHIWKLKRFKCLNSKQENLKNNESESSLIYPKLISLINIESSQTLNKN